MKGNITWSIDNYNFEVNITDSKKTATTRKSAPKIRKPERTVGLLPAIFAGLTGENIGPVKAPITKYQEDMAKKQAVEEAARASIYRSALDVGLRRDRGGGAAYDSDSDSE
jgi:hypothetical protein